MNRLTQIALIVLIATQVYCQTCTTFLTQQQCTTNNSCEWTQQPEQSCQSPSCSNYTKQVDCANPKTNCSWSRATEASCSVKSTYCTVSADTANTCTDPANCKFAAAKDATCTVKGLGFGCKKLTTQATCQAATECNWLTAYCANNDTFCRAQTGDGCKTADGCTLTITACKSLNNPCEGILEQDACEAKQCIFSNNTCSAPECTVANGCSDAFCSVSTSLCDNTPNTCNKSTTQATCTQSACAWSDAKPTCFDKTDFCTTASCDKNFCVSTPATENSCVPNTTTNTCSALNQADCGKADQCTYNNASVASCNSQNNSCPSYGQQNQCLTQVGCGWNNVYSCTAVGSGSSFAQKIMASVALFTLALLI